MQEVLHNKASVYVKPNSGATVEDMHDFVRPALRRDPSLIILHCGTNSLQENGVSSMQIARDIVELAELTKTDTNDVAISSLILRGDTLNERAREVNHHLRELCVQRNLWLIDNSNINLGDLRDGVHLNPGGTVKLADNFLRAINL